VIRAIDPAGRLSTLSAPPVDAARNGLVDGGRLADTAVSRDADMDDRYASRSVSLLAVDPDGILHFVDSNLSGTQRIWKLERDGTVRSLTNTTEATPPVFAGRLVDPVSGDTLAATLSDVVFFLTGMAFDPRGTLVIAHHYEYFESTSSRGASRENLLTSVDTDGRLRVRAGVARDRYRAVDGDDAPERFTDLPRALVPARRAALSPGGFPLRAGVAPNGDVYVVESAPGHEGTLAFIARPEPVEAFRPLVVSADGRELYEFDATGRHLRTLNALTGTTLLSFGYDNAGRLATVTDVNGGVVTVERDADGSPTAVVAPGSERTLIGTDADGRFAAITDPVGSSAGFEYTPAGLVSAVVDAEGYRTELDYDEDSRLVEVTDAAGGVTSFVRMRDEDTGEVRLTVISPELRETTYTARGTDGEELVLTTTCCGGVASEVIERPGGTATITYPDGRVATLLDRSPDPRFGALASYTSAVAVERPSGTTVDIGRERSTTSDPNPLDVQTYTETTTIGSSVYESTVAIPERRTTVRSGEGRETVVEYDDDGRPTRASADGAVAVDYTYDDTGRPASVSQGDQRLTYGYDDRGRWTTATDALGGTFGIEYDDANRPTRMIPALGPTRAIAYGYDERDDLTSVTMPNGDVHALDYSPLGRLRRYTDPLGNVRETTYDGDGAPVEATLPSGRTVTNEFDGGGRLVTASRPDSDLAATYDGNLLTELTRTPASGDPAQTLRFAYDGDAPTAIEFAGAVAGEYSYEFEDAWAPGAVTHPDGTRYELAYDRDGLLVDTGIFAVARDGPAARPTAFDDGTCSLAVTYDEIGQVVSRETSVDGAVVHRLDFVHDATGQIVERAETVDGTTTTRTYGYDADGQVTSVAVGGTTVETYTYDENGNRLERTTPDGTATATVEAGDRLTVFDGVSYAHDADGFRTARGADTFAYGVDGSLLSATVGDETVTYGVDGLARRVSRTDADGTTEYLYGEISDTFRVTTVRGPDGTVTTYQYDDAGRLLALERDGTTHYVVTDQLGSPLAVYDTTGTPVRRLAYDAFGRVTNDTNPAFDLHLGFAGGLVDPTTGLLRFGFRDYDSETGRWTALDPILFASGQHNLYAYVANDPVNFLDPSGLLSKREKCFWKEVERDYQATANWESTIVNEAINLTTVSDSSTRDSKALVATAKTHDKIKGYAGDIAQDGRPKVYANGVVEELDYDAKEKRMFKASVKSLGKGLAIDVAFKSGAKIGATINPFRDYSLGDMIGDAIYEAINGPKSTINCDVRNKKC
jgi:RHS repeat-associated protein